MLNLLRRLLLSDVFTLNIVLLKTEVAEDFVKLFTHFWHADFIELLDMLDDDANDVLERFD